MGKRATAKKKTPFACSRAENAFLRTTTQHHRDMSSQYVRYTVKGGKPTRGKIVKLSIASPPASRSPRTARTPPEADSKCLGQRVLGRLAEEGVDLERFRVLWLNRTLNAFADISEAAPSAHDAADGNGLIDCTLEERPAYGGALGYKVSQQRNDDDGFFGVCLVRDKREDGHAVVWRTGAQMGASFFVDIGKKCSLLSFYFYFSIHQSLILFLLLDHVFSSFPVLSFYLPFTNIHHFSACRSRLRQLRCRTNARIISPCNTHIETSATTPDMPWTTPRIAPPRSRRYRCGASRGGRRSPTSPR